ncbi:DNA glycosylase [Ramaria rubella]|nr:DNA glycosylase [Ramaria rubella]
MPTTRSVTALSSLASGAINTALKTARPSASPRKAKRKVELEHSDASESPSSPQQTNKKARLELSPTIGGPSVPTSGLEANPLLPAILSFSFEIAKNHLINVDTRFENIFNMLPCRPYEHLETVDPFRTLVTSIIGQQISWLAARSIIHKFIRLYFPSLPEKVPALIPLNLFPTANQVANTDVATLRSAGLTNRKSEYVQDLASRFVDGRLTGERLVEADDEELAKILIEVRGIGRVLDMFAMFSLRRPDILPVGDLGVQKGLIRWFLSLHCPDVPLTISPKKLPKAPGSMSEAQDTTIPSDFQASSIALTGSDPISSLPSIGKASPPPDISCILPMPVTPVKAKASLSYETSTPETPPGSPDKLNLDTGSMATFPEPFTPSINKTLNGRTPLNHDGTSMQVPLPLPEGLTTTILKNRLNGKKIKGAFLTPKEMEDLTEPWRPYRSLGVYYMWALAA